MNLLLGQSLNKHVARSTVVVKISYLIMKNGILDTLYEWAYLLIFSYLIK